MKLYVDDLRICPKGWTLARTNTEAIRLLASGFIDEEISIDHDIILLHPKIDDFSYALIQLAKKFGYVIPTEAADRIAMADETFQPVAYYLTVMKPEFRPKKITFHTANVDAGNKMVALLKGAGIESTYIQGSYFIDDYREIGEI